MDNSSISGVASLSFPSIMAAKRMQSTTELVKFLRERGISCGQSGKLELANLCELAKDIGLPVDPEGCIEDREEIIGKKLTDGETQLPNPAQLVGTHDIGILPTFSVFDICTYLMSNEVPLTSFRDYRRSEAYTLMQDGYVKNIEALKLGTPTLQGYYALKASVKPRTRQNDPLTGRPVYLLWVIITDVNTDNRSRLLSAFCTCKGGMDGCCRHVLAALFEVIDFLDDKKTSVTSEACLWVLRSQTDNLALLITDVETGQKQCCQLPAIPESRVSQHPTEEAYNPVPDTALLPSVQEFYDGLKQHLPNSCFLDVYEARKKPSTLAAPPLRVETPSARLSAFTVDKVCETTNCNCSDEFISMLHYSSSERKMIEEDTRGQHQNDNWFLMTTGLLTASVIKKVLSARDCTNTAKTLLLQNEFRCEKNLPAAIKFGRNHEAKALRLFTRIHRYRHRKCFVHVPGLIVSEEDAFLAGSPDAIVDCKHCGKFVVEIKCLFSKQNVHPRAAIKMSKMCDQVGDSFKLKKDHAYFCQLQCQMAVTGLKFGVLVVYTKKGIETVHVKFDDEWWAATKTKLRNFYVSFFLREWISASFAVSTSGQNYPPIPTADPVTLPNVTCPFALLHLHLPHPLSHHVIQTRPSTSPVSPCHPALSPVTPCHSVLPPVPPCHPAPSSVTPCHPAPSSVTPCHPVLPPVPPCHPTSLPAPPCHPEPSPIPDIFQASIISLNEHMSFVQSEMCKFSAYLHSKDFRLCGVTPTDGNCFFGAIGIQLARTGHGNVSQASIREMLCDYLSGLSTEQKIIIEHFIEGKTFDQYVSDMRKNGTYADHIAVEFTSKMLCKTIAVIDEPNVHVFGNQDSDSMLYIGYIASLSHYVSVEPI